MQIILDAKALSADALIDIANALSKEIDYLNGYNPTTESFDAYPDVPNRDARVAMCESQFDVTCGALESFVEEISDFVVCPHG